MAKSANSATSGKPANRRGAARLAAVQALYQMELTGGGVQEVVAEFENLRLGHELDGETYLDADKAWFRDIVGGVIGAQKSIDPVIHADLPKTWPLKRLEIILRAILRAGVYELYYHDDVDSAVVISEYVDVAKAFYEAEEPRLVNALLDTIARRIKSNDASLKPLARVATTPESSPDSSLEEPADKTNEKTTEQTLGKPTTRNAS